LSSQSIVGEVEGAIVGEVEGAIVGEVEGAIVGEVEGVIVGEVEGAIVGEVEGVIVGEVEGDVEGAVLGLVEGEVEGATLAQGPLLGHCLLQCSGQFSVAPSSLHRSFVILVSSGVSVPFFPTHLHLIVFPLFPLLPFHL